ncbi:MAG: undecaprenyl-diphosphate phosphatase [Candidatus Undinarchaeales archaeon]
MQEFLILGIIQGVLEWIPVSSEGFLVMAGTYFTLENLIPLALYLHLGTLFSASFYFRNDLKKITYGKEPELLKFLIISTVCTFIVGGPIYLFIQESQFSGSSILGIVGAGLLLTGWLLGKKKKHFGASKVNEKDAVLIGLLQGIAVLPGVSRSGITTFGLLSRNYSQESALKISFIMSIPVVLIGNILLHLTGFEFQPGYLIALTASFVIGFLTIKSLIKISKKINFRYFCWFFGVLALIGFGISLI